MRRLSLACALICPLFAAAAEIAEDGAALPPSPTGTWRIAPAEAGLSTVLDRRALEIVVHHDGLVLIDPDGPPPAPGPLEAIDATAVIAPFWADLQRAPCAPGQPAPGVVRRTETPTGIRLTWLDVTPDCAADAERARFSAELQVDAAGALRRVELRYGALPQVTGAVEPRAGVLLRRANGEVTQVELFPDSADRPLRGRGKELLNRSSDGEPGVWVFEVDDAGRWIGDVDADGIRSVDNCDEDPNPLQENVDGDPFGDPCDADIDGDAVFQVDGDNCPFTWNPGQADADADGVGDPCDDSDGDRVIDLLDGCPTIYDPAGLDLDADGTPDACDPDIDGDDGPFWGRLNRWGVVVPLAPDRCPYALDPGHPDTDRDGAGDACDLAPRTPCKGAACIIDRDADGDGVRDISDLCPTVPDPLQEDADGDGIGDACDPDLDDDGVPDVYAEAGLTCDPTVCRR